MAKPAAQSLGTQSEVFVAWKQALIVVGASLFVGLCAQVTLPLPFTPVPLTLQNFGVLVVGLLLGSRGGFAALALYLAEGLVLPLFNPSGPGGIAQLLGPTGGYLMAYPFVAFVAGWISERGVRSFTRSWLAGAAGTLLLFAGGVAWLMVLTHATFRQAANFGLYPFVFAEVMKVTAAAGVANRWRRWRQA